MVIACQQLLERYNLLGSLALGSEYVYVYVSVSCFYHVTKQLCMSLKILLINSIKQ